LKAREMIPIVKMIIKIIPMPNTMNMIIFAPSVMTILVNLPPQPLLVVMNFTLHA
jgi:hypothetical protein